MNTTPNRFLLTEDQMPRFWYNAVADLPTPLMPYLHPVTGKQLVPDDLTAIFPRPLIEQELSTERYIPIPREVVDAYLTFRPSPLVRAHRLEKALDTPAHIYFKYEGNNPSGSHKLNSAIPQAFCNKISGIKRLVSETGAGQWGTALSYACSTYGMDLTVYMVRCSYEQKPYRRTIMQLFGAEVIPSPSMHTEFGKKLLAENPDNNGALAIAIAEAVEVAMGRKDTNYALGSVLNHVVLHQTIIGQEAIAQMEMAGEKPDYVIGCNGGGSNFCGIALPFLRRKLTGEDDGIECIAVEATGCPKLTRGTFTYDYGDTAGMTPITMMYTLGHTFMPDAMHAGGLRFHGDSAILSKLYNEGYVSAEAINQHEMFEAAMLFARTEAIVPAPESAHAIASAIKRAKLAKESGEKKVILVNLSGHGNFDLSAYDNFMKGKIQDINYPDEYIAASIKNIPDVHDAR